MMTIIRSAWMPWMLPMAFSRLPSSTAMVEMQFLSFPLTACRDILLSTIRPGNPVLLRYSSWMADHIRFRTILLVVDVMMTADFNGLAAHHSMAK